MNLKKLILTNNACYKAGRTITIKGVCVHSTGANNPNLKRYVGPDDGLLGKNQYNNHWNQYKPGGRLVCVHAFIGKLADGTIAGSATHLFDCLRTSLSCGIKPEDAIQAARDGSQTFTDALSKLVLEEKITLEDAKGQIDERAQETLTKTVIQMKKYGSQI